MSRLAPMLFDRRFDDLMEIGRAQLPALAPSWTDHNAHDPGITLMELLAWVAEAQIYSLSRTRRDERLAYAALLDVAPRGTRPARGLIWPDHADPASPAATFVGSRVIDTDAAVRLEGHDELVFHPERKTLWVAGRIVKLTSRLSDGTSYDLTASNQRATAFLPFGEQAGPRDVLVMDFETRRAEGLFPAKREEAQGALWILGVRVVEDDKAACEPEAYAPPPHVSVSLAAGANPFSLPVIEDSTSGLLRTGVLVLDVSQVTGSPKTFRIEIQAPQGFTRPPRLLRIEPGILPITQRTKIEREPHEANEQPNFELDLDVPGLSFDEREDPLEVQVSTEAEFTKWERCDRLSEKGPSDPVYELDAARGRVTFGNGVNGRKPGPGAQIYITYRVCSGTKGNVARNRQWTVAGFSGVFGVNPDPVTCGAEPSDFDDLRRESRRHAKEDRALVSTADIVSAALASPLLSVARAWVVAPQSKGPSTGTVTLVVVRARDGTATTQPLETARWLEAVRRQLARRIPLGTRLVVTAPRYVDFFIRATLEGEVGRDPADVEKAVKERLKQRLALVKSPSTPEPRAPGVAVSHTEVAAWILGVEGVVRVTKLDLVAERDPADEIAVPRGGLPNLDFERSTITVLRPGTRSTT